MREFFFLAPITVVSVGVSVTYCIFELAYVWASVCVSSCTKWVWFAPLNWTKVHLCFVPLMTLPGSTPAGSQESFRAVWHDSFTHNCGLYHFWLSWVRHPPVTSGWLYIYHDPFTYTYVLYHSGVDTRWFPVGGFYIYICHDSFTYT